MSQEGIEMITDQGEEFIKEELERCRIQAEHITHQRFSDAEKVKFAKIIKDFNALYWHMKLQTWCNTKWRGVPVCKPPTDLWIYQELIEATKPDLIIETGTLAGGSALYMSDVVLRLGYPTHIISIDIRHDDLHATAKQSPVYFWQGSSVDDEIVARVKAHIAAYYCKKVMVILDSDHSKEHVLKELEIYAPLVSVGCALVVEDTGNHTGAKDAAEEWFMNHEEKGYRFRPDYMCEKFMLTFNRDGYFERVK